jgi:GT2 family glycosyltransferase
MFLDERPAIRWTIVIRKEMTKQTPITVVIPTWARSAVLPTTLSAILKCDPGPAEIIVHIDGGNLDEYDDLIADYPTVQFVSSPTRVGPGGGRNKLIELASHEYIASFDDDSYPHDTDYFSTLVESFEAFPNAHVIASAVYHRTEPVPKRDNNHYWVADFVGCGCAYRKSTYLAVGGYIPIPVAYGMEEVDFALRLHSKGRRVLRTARLRVYHNTSLKHHKDAAVTSASISNTILHAYLRYPLLCWPIGAMQVLGRLLWLVKQKRLEGICQGLSQAPQTIAAFKNQRSPVRSRSVISFLMLRRAPNVVA